LNCSAAAQGIDFHRPARAPLGLSGSHVLDAGLLEKFDASLAEHCTQHPQDSLFDALSAANAAVPGLPLKPTPKAAPKH
jgi:hypothetical protein